MSDRAVVIVGAGPTGLMLAGELALAGIDVAVIERRTNHGLQGSRAGGLTPRTLEVLDQRGIVDRFLTQGWVGSVGHFSQLSLDISDLPTRHNYGLALPQYRIESILGEWATELGVAFYRGRELVAFTQDDAGVDVELSDRTLLRATYLVGCDGGRSLVRKIAGIEFTGCDPSISCLVADVELEEEPPWGLHRDTGGFHSFFRLEEHGPVRVMVTEPHIGQIREPTLRDLSSLMVDRRATDYGMHSAAWVSRFTDVTRQAASYRNKRVLLAGDAAHVHFPIGGHGLNTGIQDATNLGWKLAQVLNGTSSPALLDTYHAERHPVGAAVLHNTMAQTALIAPGERITALRDTVSDLLTIDEPRQRLAATMCGLDVHYDLGEGHPLLGCRMPDLDLCTPTGPTRVFTLLHQATGLLLKLNPLWDFDVTPWDYQVIAVDASCAEGSWHVPGVGEVTAPDAVLVRPDGYVAWATDTADSGLAEALNEWFA